MSKGISIEFSDFKAHWKLVYIAYIKNSFIWNLMLV